MVDTDPDDEGANAEAPEMARKASVSFMVYCMMILRLCSGNEGVGDVGSGWTDVRYLFASDTQGATWNLRSILLHI